MAKRIVLAAYGVPGWGGAATSAYRLFARMQGDGLDVAYVNLVEQRDELFLRFTFGEGYPNPRGLEAVHTYILDGLRHPHPGLAELVGTLAPDVVLGCGHLAAWLLKQAAPDTLNVFWATGSSAVERLIATGSVRDFLHFRRSVARGVMFPVPSHDLERHAVEGADLILANSSLTHFVLEELYPGETGKIYATLISSADLSYRDAERFMASKRPFLERDIDVLFIANSWNRPEKNYPLVAKLALRCEGLNVAILGEVERLLSRAHHRGLIPRQEELYELLGRSKTVVCPSLIDAAPRVLFEASAMGCNVVASPNCGNWQLCHDDLLAERCTGAEFFDRIVRSVRRPYDDNRERFRDDYADLVDTLSVL